MKPPFSYYGGKQRLASKLVPLIPKHTVYVEPFAGGATLLFAKPWPEVSNNNHYREVINDTNGHLINFFRQLKDNGPELCRRLSLTLYSEQEHQTAKELEHDDHIEAACRFYVNVQQSFSNVMNAGWGRKVFTRNNSVTWMNQVDRLPSYIDRMRSVFISNQDALTCIEQWDSPQTFFYCDPPYPKANQGHYSGYTEQDFEDLLDTLKGIKGSALVSCYDHGFDMPECWRRVEFDAYASSSGNGKVGADRSRKATAEELGNRKRTEVVLIKDASQPRPEIQKLYDSGKYDCFEGVAV
jgi:DNA adenine methylase